MKYLVLFFLFASSFIGYSQETSPQNDDSLLVVTLTSGQQRIGKILTDDGREILLMTKDLGKIYISKQQISSIKPYNPEDFKPVNDEGDYVGTGPFTTRYYFTTNALPIRKGEDYAMIHLYGPEVHFAVSDRLNLGVMSTWIGSPMVFAAKYTIPTQNKNINFGLGTLMGSSGYLNSFRGFGGLHWGMFTVGDRFKNITVSAGFSYIRTGIENAQEEPGIYPAVPSEYDPTYMEFDQEIPKNPSPLGTAPVVSIAGITKIGKKASLFFDSMLFFGSQKGRSNVEYVYTTNGMPLHTVVTESGTNKRVIGFLMPGVRIQSAPNKAFQFALAGGFFQRDDGTLQTFPAPMCSWFIQF
jgi:hypothetical protein